MQRYEQMEERMEIVLTSRQIMVLAVLLVGVALVMFVVGFSMGKRSERRRVVLGTPQAAADLLTRLDEMEKESREFVAKKALTQIRKRELPVEELAAPGVDAQRSGAEPRPADGKPAVDAPEAVAAPTAPAPRAQVARPKTQGTIALNKARTMGPAAKAPVTRTVVKDAAAPAAGRTVSGSFGRAPRRADAVSARRPDGVSARRPEGRRAAAQN